MRLTTLRGIVESLEVWGGRLELMSRGTPPAVLMAVERAGYLSLCGCRAGEFAWRVLISVWMTLGVLLRVVRGVGGTGACGW